MSDGKNNSRDGKFNIEDETKNKNRNIPDYFVWIDKQGKEHRLGYIESRQFYCNFYERLVINSPEFLHLKNLVSDGYSLQICGPDAYPMDDSAVTENKSRDFGDYKISSINGHEVSGISDHEVSVVNDHEISVVNDHEISGIKDHMKSAPKILRAKSGKIVIKIKSVTPCSEDGINKRDIRDDGKKICEEKNIEMKNGEKKTSKDKMIDMKSGDDMNNDKKFINDIKEEKVKNIIDDIERAYLDPTHPFGHERILFTMLSPGTSSPEFWPWRKYKTFDF